MNKRRRPQFRKTQSHPIDIIIVTWTSKRPSRHPILVKEAQEEISVPELQI
jgi:hypothetical protein